MNRPCWRYPVRMVQRIPEGALVSVLPDTGTRDLASSIDLILHCGASYFRGRWLGRKRDVNWY